MSGGDRRFCVSALSVQAIFSGIAITLPLSAQVIPSSIIPDTSLGAESSQVSSEGQIDIIRGGAERGRNLFHSFQSFSIGENRAAGFLVPNDTIQNVLARVTGKERSEILGTLATFRIVNDQGVNSRANLFLMNPNGIVFGKNASLTVNGSFIATTANALKLGETGLFSASEPELDNLIDVEPTAFLFDAIAAQPIINRTQPGRNALDQPTLGLSVRSGQNLVLAGGNIEFDGGQIYARGGQVSIASVQGSGSVQFTQAENGLETKIPDTVSRGDISLTTGAGIFVDSSQGGGSINISARNFQASGQSNLYAGILRNAGLVETKAGNILINTTDTVRLSGNSYIFNGVDKGAIGQAGDINIRTQSLEMSEQGQIGSYVAGEGKAGNVIIQADKGITIRDRIEDLNKPTVGTGLFNRIEEGGLGQAGSIVIRTPFLYLLDGAEISASTFGKGNAGIVDLNVSNAIILNPGSIFSAVRTGGEGNGGEIKIKTGSLSLLAGSRILTIVQNAGRQPASNVKAGNINIEATDKILVAGTSPSTITGVSPASIIASAVDTQSSGKAGNNNIQTGALSLTDNGEIRAALDLNASGQAGNIEINAKTVSVSRGGTINTVTAGQGNAGNILVKVQDSMLLDGAGSLTGVFTQALKNAAGTGGNLEIKTNSLVVANGATLSTQTFSDGNAGNILIDTNRLRLESGGTISTGTESLGNAGNISINASELVEVLRGSDSTYITTSTDGIGKSGTLTIVTGRLLLRDGGFISTGTSQGSEGQGGNLTITASDSVEVAGTTQDSQFASKLGTVTEGNGNSGNLRVDTRRLIVRDGGSVSTETQGFGRGGDLTVNASESVEVSGTASNNSFVSAVTSETEQSGNAGNLDITTRRLLVKDRAYISAEARDRSTGSPGNVTINATDSIEVIGGNARISAEIQSDIERLLTEQVFQPDSRVSGKITLSTQQLRLNQAEISTTAQGFGRAGDIAINVGDRLEMQDGRILSAAFFTSGGNIQIAANQVRLRGASEIGSQVLFGLPAEDLALLGLSPGAGGNLNIAAQSIIALDRSDIFTFNQGGRGGNITFDTRAFFGQNYRPSAPSTNPISLKENDRVDINASGAVSGVITLPDTTFIQNTLSQLPQSAIDTNTIITNSCITRNSQNGTFYITGKGGLATNPGELSPYSTGSIQSTTWKRGDPIVEPQAIYPLPNGQLLLSRECE